MIQGEGASHHNNIQNDKCIHLSFLLYVELWIKSSLPTWDVRLQFVTYSKIQNTQNPLVWSSSINRHQLFLHVMLRLVSATIFSSNLGCLTTHCKVKPWSSRIMVIENSLFKVFPPYIPSLDCKTKNEVNFQIKTFLFPDLYLVSHSSLNKYRCWIILDDLPSNGRHWRCFRNFTLENFNLVFD